MKYLVLQLSTGLVCTETIIDLSVGEEWQIFIISTTIHPYFSEYTRLLKQQQQPITFFLFSNFISHLFSFAILTIRNFFVKIQTCYKLLKLNGLLGKSF